jgi:hypothetical protein
MTTKMLDAQWTADPTQPGRISAGDAIQIAVTVDYGKAPHSEAGPDRLTKAMRLVKETEALCVAAPVMAKMLLRALGRTGHTESCARLAVAMGSRGERPRICSDDCAEIRVTLTMAGVSIP